MEKDPKYEKILDALCEEQPHMTRAALRARYPDYTFPITDAYRAIGRGMLNCEWKTRDQWAKDESAKKNQ
jgi:hypothetical protein